MLHTGADVQDDGRSDAPKRPRFTRTGGARLPAAILEEIWRRAQAGESQSSIARSLRINQTNVGERIRQMRAFGGVPPVHIRAPTVTRQNHEAEAVRRRDAGESPADIASALGVSVSTVKIYLLDARKAAGIPSQRFTPEQCFEMKRRHAAGESSREIGDGVGLLPSQVRRFLRNRQLVEPMKIAKPFTAEQLRRLREKMIAGEVRTAAALSRWFDCSVVTLRIRIRELRPELIEAGVLPKCECGEYIFHPVLCSPVACRADPRRPVFVSLETERKVRESLAAGAKIKRIASAVGISRSQVAHIQNFKFSDEERKQRRLRRGWIVPSARRLIAVPSGLVGGRDPLFAEAWAHIPAWVAEDARADIAADVVVAVLEGRIGRDEVPSYVRHFAREFERKFGMDRWSRQVSLDEVFENGLTREGMFGDNFGASLVDDILVGGGW